MEAPGDAPTDVNNPYADEIRNFQVGECYVRQHNTNTKIKVKPLPDPFGVSKRTLRTLVDSYLQSVKQRPEYYSPNEDSNSTEPPPPQDRPDLPETDDSPFGII